MERKFYNVELIQQSQLFYDEFGCYMIALNKNTKHELKIWKQDERRGDRKYSQLLHLVQETMTYQVVCHLSKVLYFYYKLFINAFSFVVLLFPECIEVPKTTMMS